MGPKDDKSDEEEEEEGWLAFKNSEWVKTEMKGSKWQYTKLVSILFWNALYSISMLLECVMTHMTDKNMPLRVNVCL